MGTVDETISRARFGTKWAVKKYIQNIEDSLLPGERIVSIATPFYKINAMIILTTQRVIKYDIESPTETNIDSIPLGAISSYSVKNDFMTCDIIVKSHGLTLKVKDISLDIAHEFKRDLANLVK